ncbi:MAG: chain-length determining protein [Prevotella sp.]|nr:chain-length determining protein [Prevotella sp.]
MAEKKDGKVKVIDLRQIFKKIKERKKTYIITLPIVMVVSYLLILCVPRYYTTTMRLAPEVSNANVGGGTLSSIASSFGFDIDNVQTSDAINPMLYPDLMSDNGFVAKFFNVRVTNKDGSISTTYFDYLKHHTKAPWWSVLMSKLTGLFSTPPQPSAAQGDGSFDPYTVSLYEEGAMNAIRGNVKMDFDKKTGIISVSVTDQDPLICKSIADTMRVFLQDFITSYRTNKARVDVGYYETMVNEARHEYDSIRHAYSRFADSNNNVVLQSVKSRMEDMENEMQLKYNAYTTFSAQLQNAQARVQECTPAFTLLQGASIPNRPAGPKRVVFAVAMAIVAFLIISLYEIRDIIFKEDE